MAPVVFYGNGAVWDAVKGRVLCRFVDGKYETSDEREIAILSAYPHDGEINTESEEQTETKPKRGRKAKAERIHDESPSE